MSSINYVLVGFEHRTPMKHKIHFEVCPIFRHGISLSGFLAKLGYFYSNAELFLYIKQASFEMDFTKQYCSLA